MKAFTDIEQSKQLAEILPIKGADMYYHPYPNDEYWYDIPNFGEADLKFNQLPCWSLAAVISVIPDVSLNAFKDTKWYAMIIHNGKMIYGDKDNPIDACYELILKLHEQKLL